MCVALGITVVYLVVVPSQAADASQVVGAILRYGHSLCWAVLAGASALWAVKGANKWSGILAYTALGVYALFVATYMYSL